MGHCSRLMMNDSFTGKDCVRVQVAAVCLLRVDLQRTQPSFFRDDCSILRTYYSTWSVPRQGRAMHHACAVDAFRWDNSQLSLVVIALGAPVPFVRSTV